MLSYLFVGYRIYFSDHHVTIPFLRIHMHGPGVFPGDFVANIADQYSVLAFYFIAPVVETLGLEPAFLLLHGLSIFLLFGAVAALARLLFEHPWAPLLAVLAMVFPKLVWGWVPTYEIYLLPRDLAFPLLLWGLWGQLNKRPYLAAVLGAIGFNIHPVIGLWGLFAQGLAVLGRGFRNMDRALITSIAFGALLCIPAVLARAHAGGESTMRLIDPEWFHLIALRSKHHFLPSTYPGHFHAANLACVALVWRGAQITKNQSHAWFLRGLAIATPIAVVLTILFGEWVPIQFWLLTSPMRLARIAMVFAVCASAAVVLEEHRNKSGLLASGAFVWVLLALDYIAPPFAVMVLAWLLWPWLSKLILLRLPETWRKFVDPRWLVVVAGIAVAVSWYHHTTQLLNASVVMAAIVALSSVKRISDYMSARPAILALCLGLAVLSFGGVKLANGGGVRNSDLFGFSGQNSITKAALWAKDHTPAEALFITNNVRLFRAWSERGTIGDYKDGTYGNLSRSFAFAWAERMNQICRRSLPEWSHHWPRNCAFDEHDTESFRQLAANTGATHVLVGQDHRVLDLPLVYQNRGARIHRITNPPFTEEAAP
ncbi:MAG: hypothetical protein A2289_23365 [Deltaproteobacteria bacterium RIFOXYA12_FULL_58_15]|nr:MAG: hypothetical protein A2289_23365 [Deltaproteobacteria bacterium RIFOXYA12_FULL_58_15]OGR13288.1 MAG: hypothetical protein A2341_16130 [Deltaproteobacteria bacterium RIFOXYB12_FULL_58_9]